MENNDILSSGKLVEDVIKLIDDILQVISSSFMLRVHKSKSGVFVFPLQ